MKRREMEAMVKKRTGGSFKALGMGGETSKDLERGSQRTMFGLNEGPKGGARRESKKKRATVERPKHPGASVSRWLSHEGALGVLAGRSQHRRLAP